MELRAALVVLLVAWWALPAHADSRVALVIGNGGYTKVGALDNPPRDAEAMEALFRAAGFTVVEGKRDLGVASLRRALRDFSDQARDADIAVVFYAGHGIEVNGNNYLIPVDARLERDLDVEDEAVSLERVMQVLEPARRLRLVILDACRDNPFLPANLRRFIGIWFDETGGPGANKGKKNMLIVTRVDQDGKAEGYLAHGPPTATSFSREPAGHFRITGTIRGDTLTAANPDATIRYRNRLLADNRMLYQYENVKGQTASRYLDPVWRLVDVERAVKR
jgi:hypothetical protein